jgi:hypothetical protein
VTNGIPLILSSKNHQGNGEDGEAAINCPRHGAVAHTCGNQEGTAAFQAGSFCRLFEIESLSETLETIIDDLQKDQSGT